MPFVRIDVAEGKSPEKLTAIGDGVHAALIDAIGKAAQRSKELG